MKLHYMRTDDDCVRCVVSTQLGINYGDTPRISALYPPAEGFWSSWARWAAKRSMRWRCRFLVRGYEHFTEPPTDGLWIGIAPTGIPNYGHAVLYDGDKFIYDPQKGGSSVVRVDALIGYQILEPAPIPRAGSVPLLSWDATWLPPSPVLVPDADRGWLKL